MRVSLIPNKSFTPEGKVNIPGMEVNGTLMQQIELNAVLYACKNMMKPFTPKHLDGAIFPYINPTLGKETWPNGYVENDGVIFNDTDHISKECAKKIFDSFDEICNVFPCLYAIQYSSGHYLKNEESGLHAYISTPILNEKEYEKAAMVCQAIFARAVLVTTGIDLRLPQFKNDKGEDEIILDDHNSKITQRFFLHYSEYKINENCEYFTYDLFKKEDIFKLKKEYPDILKWYTEKEIVSTVRLDVTDGDINVKKICIDRSFKINGLSGNDVRWRISRIAQALFKDKAKDWCDKYFYCENNESIYSHQNSVEGLSFTVKEWLENEGYLTSSKGNIIKRNERIGKYKDKILKFIEKHHRSEVIAPTGTGKTTFINGERNAIKDDLFEQENTKWFSLAKELNAVVIVPFNVTNKLYNNMVEVSTDSSAKINPNEPVVMIWDQAIIHWEEIKDRTFIIDEAHTLFLDRTYRDTAIKLMNLLNENNNKLVLFTATPAGEGNELGCDYLIFNNERNNIKVDFVKVNAVDATEYKYIVKALDNNWYDRIVVMDDKTSKKIYEQLYKDGRIDDVAYIRAETKDSEDFTYLREKELLNKKLTLCTCVAFNGLNFKNKFEKILVITSATINNTTSCEIIQSAGRVRDSLVTLKVFYDEIDRSVDLDSSIEKAEILNDAEKRIDLPEGLLTYNHRLLDADVQTALRNIDAYIREKSTINNIIKELDDTGYFIISKIDWSSDDYPKGNRMQLVMKKKMSEEFIADLKDGSWKNKEYDSLSINSYKYNWKSKLTDLLYSNKYSGLYIEDILEYYDKSQKNILISTVIDYFSKVVKIATLDNNTWNKYVAKIDWIKDRLKNDIHKRDLTSSFKKNKTIRSKYANKVKLGDDGELDLSTVVDNIFFELDDTANKQHEAAVKRGQTSGNKKIKHIETGLVFDSMTEAAVYFKKHKSTISKWLKQNKIKEID